MNKNCSERTAIMNGDSCRFFLEFNTEVSMVCIQIILRTALYMAGGGTSWFTCTQEVSGQEFI